MEDEEVSVVVYEKRPKRDRAALWFWMGYVVLVMLLCLVLF